MGLIITDTQQFPVTVEPVDRRGNPAVLDGDPVWTVSDDTILELTIDTADNLSAVVRAVGPVGTAQVQVTGDARIGDAVEEITGVLDVEVIAGEAASFQLTTGTPEEQP